MFHLLTYLFGSITEEISASSFSMWPEVVLLVRTDAALIANITTLVMVVLALPILLAELVPLDRQYRVREIVDALPLSPNIYLAGKMLSIWPIIAIGLALSALVSGALSWFHSGPFHIGVLAVFWIAGMIPLSLFASQMGVMLAAGRSSRRSAVVMSLVAVAFSTIACGVLPVIDFIFPALFHAAFSLEKLADPVILRAIPSYPSMFSSSVLLRIGCVLLTMAIVWIATVRLALRQPSRHSREDLA
jgi:hypothetical protein